MIYLWDQTTKEVVGQYQEKEDAVKAVGGIVSLLGELFVRGRFIATLAPTKKGVAEIVYQPDELFRRSLVYVDRSVYERSTHKR